MIVTEPPLPPVVDTSERMLETIVLVVCSRVWRASDGAFATWLGSLLGTMISRYKQIDPTESVPELGGLMFPLVMASQMASPGIDSSCQRIVNRGESHRAIDDGSSYLWMRLSSLIDVVN